MCRGGNHLPHSGHLSWKVERTSYPHEAQRFPPSSTRAGLICTQAAEKTMEASASTTAEVYRKLPPYLEGMACNAAIIAHMAAAIPTVLRRALRIKRA